MDCTVGTWIMSKRARHIYIHAALLSLLFAAHTHTHDASASDDLLFCTSTVPNTHKKRFSPSIYNVPFHLKTIAFTNPYTRNHFQRAVKTARKLSKLSHLAAKNIRKILSTTERAAIVSRWPRLRRWLIAARIIIKIHAPLIRVRIYTALSRRGWVANARARVHKSRNARAITITHLATSAQSQNTQCLRGRAENTLPKIKFRFLFFFFAPPPFVTASNRVNEREKSREYLTYIYNI